MHGLSRSCCDQRFAALAACVCRWFRWSGSDICKVVTIGDLTEGPKTNRMRFVIESAEVVRSAVTRRPGEDPEDALR
jgi:hypothetical protein